MGTVRKPIEQAWKAERCKTCDHLRRMHWQDFGECLECNCEGFEEQR